MLIPKKYFRGRKNKNRNHAMIILFQCGKVNSQQIQDLEGRHKRQIPVGILTQSLCLSEN